MPGSTEAQAVIGKTVRLVCANAKSTARYRLRCARGAHRGAGIRATIKRGVGPRP